MEPRLYCVVYRLRRTLQCTDSRRHDHIARVLRELH